MHSTRLPTPQREEDIPNSAKTNKKATQNNTQTLKEILKITAIDDKQKRPA